MFGKVVEGMAVVKRMEVCGTKAGKPSRRVIIEDCGQVRELWQAEGLRPRERTGVGGCALPPLPHSTAAAQPPSKAFEVEGRAGEAV